MLLAIGLCAVALLLFPEPAWAWGPATHIYLGSAVLQSLALLPVAVQTLLKAYPKDFLYGSVAADISLAKKYVPEGRHCHNWHIGEEIYASAETDRLRAVGLGYLSHLAADTIAHNFFIPRQLLITSSTKGLGHAYWEHRMDIQLPESFTRVAREVVMDHDHSAADTLFDKVLSATLFSFNTNRRIFRGMVRFQDNDRWLSIFGTMLENSRWSLSDEEVATYLTVSFDYIVDYLNRREDSIPSGFDPIGDENLGMAKRIRRMAMREGRIEKRTDLVDLANNFFPIPDAPFSYLRELSAPVRA